jgi:hypothetical protein
MISLTEDLGVPDEVARAFHAACARYGHRPQVTGIDIGSRIRKGRHTKELCVRIHIKEKVAHKLLTARERFPKKVGQIPVDVIQARYARHTGSGVAAPTGVGSGTAIRNRRSTNGTLGAFVRDGAGMQCLLSASHVLAPHDTLSPGDIVRAADDVLIASAQNMDLRTDSAVARLEAGVVPSSTVAGSGVTLSGTAYPQKGDVLEKSGAVTGVTRARVEGFGKYNDGNIDGVGLAFRLVALPGETGLISDFGDSGAIWYTTDGQNQDPRRAIGLHVKGNPDQNPHDQWAVATMMPAVCSVLKVTLL